MKTFVTILLLAAIGCFADQTTKITSKLEEFKDKHGRVVGTAEEFYRGKDRVMLVTSSVDTNGNLVVRSRNYFVHGDMVTTELAVRKDDKLDTILIHHPGTKDMEVFRRHADGSVSPASPALWQAFKDQDALMTSALSQTNLSAGLDENTQKSLEGAQTKINEAMKASEETK